MSWVRTSCCFARACPCSWMCLVRISCCLLRPSARTLWPATRSAISFSLPTELFDSLHANSWGRAREASWALTLRVGGSSSSVHCWTSSRTSWNVLLGLSLVHLLTSLRRVPSLRFSTNWSLRTLSLSATAAGSRRSTLDRSAISEWAKSRTDSLSRWRRSKNFLRAWVPVSCFLKLVRRMWKSSPGVAHSSGGRSRTSSLAAPSRWYTRKSTASGGSCPWTALVASAIQSSSCRSSRTPSYFRSLLSFGTLTLIVCILPGAGCWANWVSSSFSRSLRALIVSSIPSPDHPFPFLINSTKL